MGRIDLASAGVSLSYAVESTAGTRPTTAYVKITGLKEVPDMNPAPDTLESTTLDELEYKTYVNGLKDLGGALGFTFNLTQEFITLWEALISAHGTAKAAGKGTWFQIIIPGITKALAFKGQPSELGLPGISVNSVIEASAYITPVGEPAWETAGTIA